MTKARDIANAGTALSAVSATELGYLDGVTSAVQTQIDSKIGSASAINPTIIDAKGDLIVGSAADTAARLAVGTNNYVLTADSSATNGVKWAAPAAGGKVLQVVTASSSGGFSTTSSSYSDTNLSVSITPSSASSKILVFVTQQYQMQKTNYAYGGLKLVRNSSDIKDWGSPLLGINIGSSNSAEVISLANFHYLDSPSTTSSTTYKTQMKSYDGATVQANNLVSSIITVLEIGA